MSDGAVPILPLDILRKRKKDAANKAFRMVDVREESSQGRHKRRGLLEAGGGTEEIGKGVVGCRCHAFLLLVAAGMNM